MKKLLWLTAIGAIAVVSGCGGNSGGTDKGGQSGAAASPKSAEPVTLLVASDYSVLVHQDVADYYKQLVSKKYPNITLEFADTSGPKLDQLLGSGQVPDIINTYTSRVPSYMGKDLLVDQTPYIKNANIDLNRIDDAYLRDVRTLSDKGELYGVPFFVNFFALYYNKDLFDKFGVAYPKDGMTYDDVAEMAKKLTRVDGSTKYWGLSPVDWGTLAGQMSIPLLDPKTSKSNFNTDSFRKVFELGKKIAGADGLKAGDKVGDFVKDGNVAMSVASNILTNMAKVSYNWDVVQAPSLEKPNIFPVISPHLLSVTKTSKHKDEAMQAIGVIISDEMQTWLAEQASTPVLKSQDVLKKFGTGIPQLKDKHIQSIFKSKPAAAVPTTPYTIKANAIVNKIYTPFIQGDGPDLNTLLGQTDEAINKMVATETSK